MVCQLSLVLQALILSKRLIFSVADPGCLSRIRIFSIPDPGSEFLFHPGSRICIKNLSILTQKIVSSSEIGSRLLIPDQDPDFTHLGSRIPNPGVKKAPDPGSGSTTLLILRPNSALHRLIPQMCLRCVQRACAGSWALSSTVVPPHSWAPHQGLSSPFCQLMRYDTLITLYSSYVFNLHLKAVLWIRILIFI